jgi:hypothetical protein
MLGSSAQEPTPLAAPRNTAPRPGGLSCSSAYEDLGWIMTGFEAILLVGVGTFLLLLGVGYLAPA